MRGRFFVCLAFAAPPRPARLSRCSNSHKAMKNKKNLLEDFSNKKPLILGASAGGILWALARQRGGIRPSAQQRINGF